MTARRTRAAVAAALIAAAAATTALSGAAFTAGRDEPASTVAAGRLELSVAHGAGAPVDATGMRPGVTRTRTFALHNAGTVDAGRVDVTVGGHVAEPADDPLSAVIVATLEDCGADAACAAPGVAYTGSLQAFTAAHLGGVTAGGDRHVRLTLAWPAADADPARQGAHASADITWTAIAGEAAE